MFTQSENFSKFLQLPSIRNETAKHLLEVADLISAPDAFDVQALKRIFRIREGEFLCYRVLDVWEILRKEFLRIYSDAFVDRKEELEKVNLQTLFDLSYDQF